MNRPSLREIDKKLREAKGALTNKRAFFANYSKAVGELMKLNILDNEELWQLISKLIDEIRLDHYAGGHPPQKSYEPLISECELWAFTWSSFVLRKQMYLKFALKEGTFYYVSLHESKFVSKINERKNDEMFEMR